VFACCATLERSIKCGVAVSHRHHDDTMVREKNQAKNKEKYLILLNNMRA
jgi:hypothetical protein